MDKSLPYQAQAFSVQLRPRADLFLQQVVAKGAVAKNLPLQSDPTFFFQGVVIRISDQTSSHITQVIRLHRALVNPLEKKVGFF